MELNQEYTDLQITRARRALDTADLSPHATERGDLARLAARVRDAASVAGHDVGQLLSDAAFSVESELWESCGEWNANRAIAEANGIDPETLIDDPIEVMVQHPTTSREEVDRCRALLNRHRPLQDSETHYARLERFAGDVLHAWELIVGRVGPAWEHVSKVFGNDDDLQQDTLL